MTGQPTSARWEAVQTDSGVDVAPIADVVQHVIGNGGECLCGPRTEPVERPDGSMAWMYVHHSLDGREAHE